MRPFTTGEQVIIRQGDRGGQRVQVVEPQRAEVYKVRSRDGNFLYYSGQQLRLVTEEDPRAPERRV